MCERNKESNTERIDALRTKETKCKHVRCKRKTKKLKYRNKGKTGAHEKHTRTEERTDGMGAVGGKE